MSDEQQSRGRAPAPEARRRASEQTGATAQRGARRSDASAEAQRQRPRRSDAAERGRTADPEPRSARRRSRASDSPDASDGGFAAVWEASENDAAYDAFLNAPDEDRSLWGQQPRQQPRDGSSERRGGEQGGFDARPASPYASRVEPDVPRSRRRRPVEPEVDVDRSRDDSRRRAAGAPGQPSGGESQRRTAGGSDAEPGASLSAPGDGAAAASSRRNRSSRSGESPRPAVRPSQAGARSPGTGDGQRVTTADPARQRRSASPGNRPPERPASPLFEDDQDGALVAEVVEDDEPRHPRVIVGAFVLIIAFPLVLWTLGLRAADNEGRVLASRPSIGAGHVLDPAWYRDWSRYLADQNPMRQPAAEFASWVKVDVFNESPSGAVVIGADNWLFLSDEVTAGCKDEGVLSLMQDGSAAATTPRPFARLDEMMSVLDRLNALVTGTGRTFRMVVPPSKVSLYPEQLPGDVENDSACALDVADDLSSELDSRPYGVDLLGPLRSQKDAAGLGLYNAMDTHWTTRGSVIMSEKLVNSYGVQLWEPDAVSVQGQDTIVANLGRVIGRIADEKSPRYRVQRPGVGIESVSAYKLDPANGNRTLIPAAERFPAFVLAPDQSAVARQGPYHDLGGSSVREFISIPAADKQVIPGNTLLVHDSFSWMAMDQLPEYFAHLTMGYLYSVQQEPWFVTGLKEANNVVVEIGEPSSFAFLRDDSSFLNGFYDAFVPDYQGQEVPLNALQANSDMESTGGTWTTKGDDGQLVLPIKTQAQAGARAYLSVTIKSPVPTFAAVFVGDGKGWNAEQTVSRNIIEGEQSVTFDLGDYPAGLSLRFDPADQPGVEVTGVTLTMVPDGSTS
ncbi:MAG: hypothetical protein KAZ88_11240 [Acidimicrobiia bacterium]|nr:hypothetical protein [Acidimicrobiia bacterium]